MEEISPTLSFSPTENLCGACFKHVSETDAFCESCGYPLKGTEQEQNYFISVRNAKEIDLEDATKKIRNAGNVLYWIAGATVLSGLIFYFMNHDAPALIVNLILGFINVCLGIWSKNKPLAAIISGFALYVLVILLNAIENPVTIMSGIILKILFIGYFIKGIKSAIDAEKLKKDLNIG